MADSFSASNYVIFDEATSTTNNLVSKIEDANTSLKNNGTKLNDNSIFMGPIADSCQDAITDAGSKLSNLMSNYKTVTSYLESTSKAYKDGDENAAKLVLRVGKDSKLNISTKGALVEREEDLPLISINDVTSCQNVEEYLDLVMPVYSFYCDKYGIQFPGVLALQPVHEHGAPTGIHAPSAVQDNNLGGLKYSTSIPHAQPGTYPSDGTGGQYSRFNNINEYIEAACWNIAEGSYYHDAMAKDNMADFTTSLVNTWVGHEGNYGTNIINEYPEYELDIYEL